MGDGFWAFVENASPWFLLLAENVALVIFFIYALVRNWLWINANHNQVVQPLQDANRLLQEANKELREQNGKLIEQADVTSQFFQEIDKLKADG